jgi:hypothetical protein
VRRASGLTQAAWVPEVDELDWDEASALAIQWVEERCAAEGASALVVTTTVDALGLGLLSDFAARHGHATRRSVRGRPGGPVLAYCVQLEDLEHAQRLAQGSSLAAVEGFSLPLAGWAAVAGAENLFTGERANCSDEVAGVVDELAFHGNNAFGDSYGKSRAAQTLAKTSLWSVAQRAALPGAVLAAGVSARGAKNLAALIERST